MKRERERELVSGFTTQLKQLVHNYVAKWVKPIVKNIGRKNSTENTQKNSNENMGRIMVVPPQRVGGDLTIHWPKPEAPALQQHHVEGPLDDWPCLGGHPVPLPAPLRFVVPGHCNALPLGALCQLL